MFLTILEDEGKITRIWDELTTRKRHVKTAHGSNTLASTPEILRICPWDINRHHEANFHAKLESLKFKEYLVGYQRNTWYKHLFSLSSIYGFNDHFHVKPKITVNTNNNFKSKTSNNENQVEINYRKTSNKTNLKLKCK